jgi:hypothetical protein
VLRPPLFGNNRHSRVLIAVSQQDLVRSVLAEPLTDGHHNQYDEQQSPHERLFRVDLKPAYNQVYDDPGFVPVV